MPLASPSRRASSIKLVWIGGSDHLPTARTRAHPRRAAPPRAHGGDHARASGRVVGGPRAHRGRGPPRGARGGVVPRGRAAGRADRRGRERSRVDGRRRGDRKSTRLNSSHGYISYAVFCLKKKKKEI